MDEVDSCTVKVADDGRSDELRRVADRLRADDDSRAIVEGFAGALERLRAAVGGGRTLDAVASYYLEFARQLVGGHETLASGRAILELSVPQRREALQRLLVQVRHCVDDLADGMDSVKKCYRDANRYAEEAATDADARAELLDKIRWAADFAVVFADQAIREGDATLDAIRDFDRDNKAYHWGYRSVLHGILLLVAVGLVAANVATKGLHAYETLVLGIGFLLYLVLEHAWWAYTTHKIAVAQKGLLRQTTAMKELRKRLERLHSSSSSEDGAP